MSIMGDGLGDPSYLKCVNSMTPPPGTVHAVYRTSSETTCTTTASPFPFHTISLKGRTFSLPSLFNHLKKNLKKSGETEVASVTYDDVDAYTMVEIFTGVPIFIKVDKKNKYPLPVFKENGWGILFLKKDPNGEAHIQEMNRNNLANHIQMGNKLDKYKMLPDALTKLSVLHSTNIADRLSRGYCTTVDAKSVCPDINFEEFLKDIGIIAS